MSTHALSHDRIYPPLVHAGEQLRHHYDRHQNGAGFWNAYQAIQDQLTGQFPHAQHEICNSLARAAQRLGAVEKACLVEADAEA